MAYILRFCRFILMNIKLSLLVLCLTGISFAQKKKRLSILSPIITTEKINFTPL